MDITIKQANNLTKLKEVKPGEVFRFWASCYNTKTLYLKVSDDDCPYAAVNLSGDCKMQNLEGLKDDIVEILDAEMIITVSVQQRKGGLKRWKDTEFILTKKK